MPASAGPTTPAPTLPPRFSQLSADQQIRVTAAEGPATPVAIDAQRATAWLHRQIAFDHEPLELVAAEYNRYTSKPIEIATPALADQADAVDAAIEKLYVNDRELLGVAR